MVATLRRRRVLRAPKTIKVGSDFSGLDAGIIAMRRMGLPIELKFCSDKAPDCRKFIEHTHKPDVMFGDVLQRTPAEETYVDAYLWTPPCQSFSASGKNDGISDSRGTLISVGCKFIHRNRPRLAIMENVPGLVFKKHKHVLNGIVKCLKSLDYDVHTRILNSADYGVPQSRRRVYLVAIRNDSLRHGFTWPEPTGSETVDAILDPLNSSDKPGRLTTAPSGKQLALDAYAKAYAAGVDPRTIPVLVDVDCSPAYAVYGVNIAKTITRARGQAGGPWVSTRGRRTSMTELMKLQGIDDGEVPWAAAGLTKRQVGMMVGNSMSVPVIGMVLAEALYAAGLTTRKSAFRV